MPTIDHKNLSPEQPKAETTVAKVAAVIASEGIKHSDLEEKIVEILQKRKAEREVAATPKEPNWATVTEADAYKPDVHIPIIDHDVPDYMNMRLKDQEYMCVWANKDQRRLGALLAEGYELLQKEHVHPDFKVPLAWSSEGTYEYADTVCMRVHKRIILSKRRKSFEISQKQLSAVSKLPRQRIKGTLDLADDVNPLGSGMDFYESGV